MIAEFEDDHPTQRSLPLVRLSEIREIDPLEREACSDLAPDTIPTHPPVPSLASVARPTLVSPSDPPPSQMRVAERVPPPPPVPPDLPLTASAALPLVPLAEDQRATVRALAVPLTRPKEEDARLGAFAREIAGLRRRNLWLTIFCALSLSLSAATLGWLALRPAPAIGDVP